MSSQTSPTITAGSTVVFRGPRNLRYTVLEVMPSIAGGIARILDGVDHHTTYVVGLNEIQAVA